MTQRCPTPVDLERAFWSDDAEVRAHALGCARCAPQWAEIGALVDAGRALAPAPSSPQRREELRTTILATLEPAAAPVAAARPRWLSFAPLAAAAAIMLGWWGWSASRARSRPPEAVVSRGHVLDHPGARYLRQGSGPDEIVRLIDGTLSLQVDPLTGGARFRVITGDAEVEGRGTAFDVTAVADRLVAVRVFDGAVEIRSAGETRRVLAGETWRAELLGDAGTASAPVAVAPVVPAVVVVPADVATAPTVEPTAAVAPIAVPPRRRRAPDRAHRVERAPDPLAIEEPADEPTDDREPAAPAQRAFDDGFAAIRRGAYDDAAAAFARASGSADPGVVEDAAFWRAVALARAGQPGRAIRAFEAFLDDHADAARAGEASVMLGWLLLERSDHAGAVLRFRGAARDPSARIRRSAAEGVRAAEAAGSAAD